jgi:hypothetical protein
VVRPLKAGSVPGLCCFGHKEWMMHMRMSRRRRGQNLRSVAACSGAATARLTVRGRQVQVSASANTAQRPNNAQYRNKHTAGTSQED